MGVRRDEPVLLVRWYDYSLWFLERIDSFPKNQRFVLGTRLADTSLDMMRDDVSLTEAQSHRGLT